MLGTELTSSTIVTNRQRCSLMMVQSVLLNVQLFCSHPYLREGVYPPTSTSGLENHEDEGIRELREEAGIRLNGLIK